MGSEIKRWQQSVVRDADSEASLSKQDGFVSRLSGAACELFHLFLEEGHLKTTRPHRRTLSQIYDYLQLWCDGYGVSSGDLDAALSESKRLRHDTCRLLVSICHTLANKMTIPFATDIDDWRGGLYKKAARTRDLIEEVTFANEGDNDSDSTSDSESDTSFIKNDFNIEDIIKDLETDVRCLVDLGPRYKEPIRDRTVKERPALPSLAVNWDPAEHLASRIRHRYPNGDVAFAHTLGQLNWERAKRLYAARETNARASERPSIKLAAASRAKGTVVASDFHDSGLGTTLASPTSYAETVLSYRGTKGGSISVPQIPPEGMKGEPFLCGICGCICQLPAVNWKPSWKRHVFSDLEPYVCIMPECKLSHVPFPEKNTWIQHLKLEHDFPGVSKQMTCPLCKECIGSGGIAHLARHLEEVSLTILPTNTESDDESDENPEEISKEEPGIPYETLAKRPVNRMPSESGSEVLDMDEPGEKPEEASEGEAASLPHPLDSLEELKKGGIDKNPNKGDFVLFEGVRDDLVYFPPLLDNTEGLHGASRELPEDTAYSRDLLRGVPLQNPKRRGGKNRRDYPSSWGFDKGQMTMKKRVMAVFDGAQPTRGSSLSFWCPQLGCKATFTRKDDLERHQHRHWYDEGRWRCMEPGCATKWSTEEQLDHHHAETHAKPEFHTEAKPDDSKARPVGSKGRGLLDPDLESPVQVTGPH